MKLFKWIDGIVAKVVAPQLIKMRYLSYSKDFNSSMKLANFIYYKDKKLFDKYEIDISYIQCKVNQLWNSDKKKVHIYY